jgi:hypothetical protein
MIEDTAVKICKRGHPRIPENFYIRPTDGARQCRACRKLRKARSAAVYAKTAKGRANRNRAQADYAVTTKAGVVGRRYKLKGQRGAVLAKLEALKREEQNA